MKDSVSSGRDSLPNGLLAGLKGIDISTAWLPKRKGVVNGRAARPASRIALATGKTESSAKHGDDGACS